jgi:hypothetical protein
MAELLRRFAILVALVLLIAPAAAEAGIIGQPDPPAGRPDYCAKYPALQTVDGSKQRAKKGWNADKVKTNKGAQERVRIQSHCAPTKEGRKRIRDRIAKARSAYKAAKFEQARERLYDKITSAPGQARLAVLRQCESTNRYNDPSAPAGAYGMLQGWSLSLSYWTKKLTRYFGYPSSPPYTATPDQQDIAASLLYQHHGTSPWECGF